MSKTKEFGDFQTPSSLAEKVVSLVDKHYGTPEIIIEPTSGRGNFISAIHRGSTTPLSAI